MDRKDSTSTRKLASASELRGKKSGMPGGKKGGRKMWLSLVSLVVVLGIAVGIYYLSGVIKPEEEPIVQATLPPTNTVKVVDREKKDVASVTIQVAGEEPYTVISNVTTTGAGEDVKYSYTYEIEGRPDFKLNTSTAESIIGYAANMTATQQIAEGVTDLASYGLDKPGVTATMKYRDGSQAVWHFGNKLMAGSGYYMLKEGTSTVFAIYTSAYDSLNKALGKLYVVDMPVTFADMSAIQHLLIEQKGKETIELRYLEETENTFSISSLKLAQPIEYDAHSDRAGEILTACAALTVTGYAGEKSELPESGLDDPRAKIYVTDGEGNKLSYMVGNYRDNGSVYVQIDDTDAVYLADASTLTFLDNANVNYLVDQFANLVNIAKVTELTVSGNGEQYTMSIDRVPELDENGVQKTATNGRPATIDTYFFEGEVTDEELFKDLYQVIIGTMVSKVHNDYDYTGKVAVSVTYKLNEAPHEFTIEYMEYDDEYYAVRRDNLTLFLIKQDKIDNLLAQMENYRNGTFVEQN